MPGRGQNATGAGATLHTVVHSLSKAPLHIFRADASCRPEHTVTRRPSRCCPCLGHRCPRLGSMLSGPGLDCSRPGQMLTAGVHDCFRQGRNRPDGEHD